MNKLTQEQQYIWDLLKQQRNNELEDLLDTIRERTRKRCANDPTLIPCKSFSEQINLE